jgi:hypothetical protein
MRIITRFFYIVITLMLGGGGFRPAFAETMTSSEFLSEFQGTIASSGSGDFVPFTESAVESIFEYLLESLLDNDIGAAEDEIENLADLGISYKLIEFSDSSESIIGFMEDASPGDADYNGWGAVLMQSDSPGFCVLQAPHVKSDLYSEEITLNATLSNENVLVTIFSGTRRDTNGDDDGDGEDDSDVAHEEENLFHILTEYLAERGDDDGTPYWFIQFHGASDRSSEPTVTGSNGADSPELTEESPLVLIDDEVDGEGYLTMGVCGWEETGTDEDEDGDYYLAATTNIQGDLLESLGLRESFMHFELERTARDDYHGGSGDGYDGIIGLFEAIETVLSDSFFSTSSSPTSTFPNFWRFGWPNKIRNRDKFILPFKR